MWLCMFWPKFIEKTYENSQWRKAKQMQSMWLRILLRKRFEDTFENTHWRKAKQMQPMWLCHLFDRPFEKTFENAHWRKAKIMQPKWICLFWCRWFEGTLVTRSGEKPNKCSQSNYATSHAGYDSFSPVGNFRGPTSGTIITFSS